MTVTLHLQPELEAGLLEKAQARGMDVDRYIQSLLEQEVLALSPQIGAFEESGRRNAVQQMLEFGERHRLSFGEPITRQSLHQSHRL